ncbi:hypothetical protein XCR1_2410006 [Xenorhabdus cabanillasii JM26]|uniref:Uncharacterized protein n=1 Tax=Xenorhabdus cabanillasii JM26 TaxID=1427517 RepID=W1J501_9GAMM|nr:hypothetical protein XCR1_2410006 [Xenorhabdus cabanillasii JM26]
MFPVLLYPAVTKYVSVSDWYVYSYMLIAIAFSYLSAFGYFKLVLSSNTTK